MRNNFGFISLSRTSMHYFNNCSGCRYEVIRILFINIQPSRIMGSQSLGFSSYYRERVCPSVDPRLIWKNKYSSATAGLNHKANQKKEHITLTNELPCFLFQVATEKQHI